MVNFNTLKQNEKRLPASSDEVSEVAPRIPKFFKKLLPAFLLLAAFLPADLVAQCSITCKPDSSVSKFLDAVTGIESVSFNDIVEPGSFGCTPTGTPTFTVDIPTVDCSHIPGITITATVSNGLGESKSCIIRNGYGYR
jgi:hypothetical protein